MTAQDIFARLTPTVLGSVDIDGPVRFDIGDAVWTVDFAGKTVTEGKGEGPFSAIVTAAEGDFVALVEGRMTAADGLITGRLKLAGEATALAHLVDGLGALVS